MKEVVGAFMNEEQFPKLDKEESLQCEGMISEDEAGLALCSMKNGSSPGRDGLTIEFMNFFWNRVETIATNTFKESFIKG